MSTLIKSTANGPLMHMTSDERTVAELEGDPIATTVFHSDLPYVLTSEQFDITTYTEIYNSGARSFDIPQACKEFREDNPRRLYFTILYDEDGGALFHYPMGVMRFEVGTADYIAASASGCEYQVFYDDANFSEFNSATQSGMDDPDNNTVLKFRFDRWEPTSEKLVVVRHEAILNANLNFSFTNAEKAQFDLNDRMVSTNNDIVRIRIVFLNTEVTANGLGFNQKADFSELNEIRISPASFDIGNYDLANNTPLRIIRTSTNEEEIQNVYGEAISFKRPDITDLTQEPTYQKVLDGATEREDFTFADAGMIVVDIPKKFDLSGSPDVLKADLVAQTISRARSLPTDYTSPFTFTDDKFSQVFSSTTAGSGMRVVGTRSLSYTLDLTVSKNQTAFYNLTDWTTGFDEDVFFIATLDMLGEFTGAHIMTVGDNLYQKINLQNYNARQNAQNFNVSINFDLRIFVEIDTNFRCRARAKVITGNYSLNGDLDIDFTNVDKIALLAIAR